MSEKMEVTTTVMYSCAMCGLVDIQVKVTAREADEDIAVWMEKLGYCLAADHQKRSPHCHPKTLSKVMIPMTGTDRVGGPAIN